MRTWATCKPQKTLPARTHWSTTILSRKMAAHEGAFMSLFTRQSGGQRVVPSQDSEDTQQQFSRARPRSVLQATGSWAGAWERGYGGSISGFYQDMLSTVYLVNASILFLLFCAYKDNSWLSILDSIEFSLLAFMVFCMIYSKYVAYVPILIVEVIGALLPV